MSIMEATNDTQKSLDQAVRGLVESQFQLLQMMQINNQMFAAAIDALAQAISAPRQLITDANGNPVGAAPQLQQGNPNAQ